MLPHHSGVTSIAKGGLISQYQGLEFRGKEPCRACLGLHSKERPAAQTDAERSCISFCIYISWTVPYPNEIFLTWKQG
jgi:hypothetical protein